MWMLAILLSLQGAFENLRMKKVASSSRGDE
jgi:hypothetical protein